MKKLLLFIAVNISIILGSFALLPANVSAVDIIGPVCNQTGGQSTTVCQDNSTNSPSNPIFGPDGIMTLIIQIFAFVTGVAAVVMLIVTGIRMAASSGDSNSFNAARQSFIYALVGLVIAACAQLIVLFILKRL